MPGLLYPAYQKLYSALSNLERFDKESNFFDNISAIDSFFNEYRNITFVMQSSLKHTEFFGAYEKNRDTYLTDHWFIDKRNETIKKKPFNLIKEIIITLYLPFGDFRICEQKYSVENDTPLDSVLDELKKTLNRVAGYEVCFSASFSFHEADSDIELLERILRGISSMVQFMNAMEHDVGENCPLCKRLKEQIDKFVFTKVPADFLLVNDYTYFPQKDLFEKAERISMSTSLDGAKVASRQPVTNFSKSPFFNFDGTVFGCFTLMHALLRAIHPGYEIMPAILVVYEDETFDLDTFNATMKTTMYRKLAETARLVERQSVKEVCYECLYSIFSISDDIPKTSHERIRQSTSDILVCASVDKQCREKEYVFDGSAMESTEYVACVMSDGPQNKLDVSAINLFPIKCAFQKKSSNSQ